MAITHAVTEFQENPFGMSAAGLLCFFCGEFLTDPGVMWHGGNGETVYFHGACVLDWTPRIMRDALELKYADHPCQKKESP
jgi:hypothetical protein